ncbi:MAG: DUF2961 domain-containing protein [Geodermatophilaceae bacterium]|nr:DUF2961 domain-containing protein [Geodermatophilaceae bacterium]
MKRRLEFALILVLASAPASSLVAQSVGGGSLRTLPDLRDGVTSGRSSSYDRTGGNNDRVENIEPGQKLTIASLDGPGTITHIWMTIASRERAHLRRIVLRAWWDGERAPSIESPVGDFFGVGFGEPLYWSSAPLAVADRGMNSYFSMPYARGARIEIENQGKEPIRGLYYQVDYESYATGSSAAAAVARQGRLHAWWHRELTRAGNGQPNINGADNYLLMDAVGRGQYVGVVLHVQGLATGWWGEGDDMFFIDGAIRPTLNGTGLEDYFGGAWNFNGIRQEFNSPYFGYSRRGNADYTGRHSMYRFHIADPITFHTSLRATIEHGHANLRADDYSSVAYWYQTEPHRPFPPLPPAEDRLPLDQLLLTPKP